jgi:hypothetical protein
MKRFLIALIIGLALLIGFPVMASSASSDNGVIGENYQISPAVIAIYEELSKYDPKDRGNGHEQKDHYRCDGWYAREEDLYGGRDTV